MTSRKKRCSHSRHWTIGFEDRRTALDDRLHGIPKQEGGAHGHTCAYCAYERGWNDAVEAMRAAADFLPDIMEERFSRLKSQLDALPDKTRRRMAIELGTDI